MLEIHESPACSVVNRALDVTDTVGTVASVGSTVALIAGMVPAVAAAAPAVMIGAVVTGGVVGVYTVGRSIATLVDRGQRDQVQKK